jgi:hypothetical protein
LNTLLELISGLSVKTVMLQNKRRNLQVSGRRLQRHQSLCMKMKRMRATARQNLHKRLMALRCWTLKQIKQIWRGKGLRLWMTSNVGYRRQLPDALLLKRILLS